MSGDDRLVHIGGSLLVLVLLASLALRCNSDTSPKVMIRTFEQHLQSNQVDADGVIVEIRPADWSISKESRSDDDCIVVSAGTTIVVIADGRLTVNSIPHGSVSPGDLVLVDNNVVYVNDERRVPENEETNLDQP